MTRSGYFDAVVEMPSGIPRQTTETVIHLLHTIASSGCADEVALADCRPTGCALAAPPPIDGNNIVADTGAEKRPISLDAKRRPLQARVGRKH